MPPTIRRTVAGDAAVLAALRIARQREVGVLTDGREAVGLEAAHQRSFAARPPTAEFLAWIARAEGDIVATSGPVVGHRPPSRGNPTGVEAYVMNIYTLPTWRGRGLGRALLAAPLGHVATTDAGRVWLHASASGHPLSERAGFVPAPSSPEAELELLLG